MFTLFEKKATTPEEIKDSRVARNAFKASIELANQQLTKAIQLNKPKGFVEKDFAPVKLRIQKATEWIATRPKAFVLDIQDQKDIFENDLKDLYSDIQIKGPAPKEKQKEEPKKAKVIEKQWFEKTNTEVLKDALYYSFIIFIVILFLGIGIRAGSVMANQYISYPIPFRILTFIYGALLSVYTVPFYTYEYIRVKLNKRESLLSEAMIPIYETSEPVTNIFDSMFNYFKSPLLLARLQSEGDKLEKDRLAVLKPEV